MTGSVGSRSRACIVALLWALPWVGPREASALVRFDRQFSSCADVQISYAAGGTATVALLTGEPGGIPSLASESDGLRFSCERRSEGQALSLRFQLGNGGPEPTSPMRLLLVADPDGDPAAPAGERGIADFGPAADDPSEPVGYRIGSVEEVLADSQVDFEDALQLGDPLDGSDGCGSQCDVLLAAQWDVPPLAPGTAAYLEVLASDDGTTRASRSLRSASGAAANTAPDLTLSGTLLVPEPGSAATAAAIALAALARRRAAMGGMR